MKFGNDSSFVFIKKNINDVLISHVMLMLNIAVKRNFIVARNLNLSYYENFIEVMFPVLSLVKPLIL